MKRQRCSGSDKKESRETVLLQSDSEWAVSVRTVGRLLIQVKVRRKEESDGITGSTQSF